MPSECRPGHSGFMRALRATTAYDGSGFLEGGATVVYDGDRIIGVESATYELPSDVPVTAYDGTLLPGLFDTHVHLVADGSMGSLERAGTATDDELDAMIQRCLAAQAAAGVTTVRDLGDVGYRTLLHRDAARPGEPRIVTSGPPITVPDGHCHYLGGVVDGLDGVRAAIKERVERGVDVVKVMASGGMLTPNSDILGVQFGADELLLLVETAHDAGLPVVAHAHSLAGIWHAIHAGADGIEHFSGLTADGPAIGADVLEAVVERGIVIGPTFGADMSVVSRMGTPPPQIAAVLAKLNMTAEDGLTKRVDTLAPLLAAHGVTVVSGVDAGVGPPKTHGNAWIAVHDLVRGGWPVDRALATATSVAAEACRLGEVTGRLAPGYAADLLVVDGDLRTDPKALGRPVEVIVRGMGAVGPM